ncbi:4Fe-4S dicluster domain-containing protein [Aurantimonas sp. HBX-1]|uniref:4Fe-4S dicluster domain-containing protein n=1 Tax=Aurantimonas sp. HBX-1 TaxID=2906072 RepID=UPI001F2F4655|nr:4Fe-4S dicluster domain-containing protein [Aurantimonas sp. HBX-1]UIJ73187.1 4Fe-4S dicluster domain-containing protein [Aurantimonas sp. HBX-1]
MTFTEADVIPRDIARSALSALTLPEPPLLALHSDGVVLVYGRDMTAIEAGQRLAETLDVTVLLTDTANITIPAPLPFPVARGRIVSATGHFGAYEATVDGFAPPRPAADGGVAFGAPRDGAVSRCDLILDLSGEAPLFPAHEARDGYLKADPADPEALSARVAEAAELVGDFDKPVYVAYRKELCAHSRSGITGCTRCLDACAMEAITPAGDHVAIDAAVCAGCGNCAAVCPTGAATYTLPTVDVQLDRLRTLLLEYRAAGGRDAVVLFHDGYVGAPLIEAVGADLPANVLPFPVNEIKQIGLESLAAALAYGAAAVRILARREPRNGIVTLAATVALAADAAKALGYGEGACSIVHADAPGDVLAGLALLPLGTPSPDPATFKPVGNKRGLLELSLGMLHQVAPTPVPVVALPEGAPFGAVDVEVDGCTLCHSCVTACPTGALSAGEDRPMLRFLESACVQCGLCEATCPEDVITLRPQLDFAAWASPRRTLKEEEPFCCISCAKPFGTRSTIERVIAKLEGSHWMFSGENARRLDAIRMCEDCRVEAVLNEGIDPYAGPQRPKTRTADDYKTNPDQWDS